MWIITTDGFYSAVRARSGLLMVRCRAHEDADRLQAWLRVSGVHATVRYTPERDYLYRLEVPAAAFARYLAEQAAAIDYPNFKAEVKKVDRERAKVYEQVWLVLALGIQWGGRLLFRTPNEEDVIEP